MTLFKKCPGLVLALLFAVLGVDTQAQTTGILREVYENIGGNAVSDLTNSPNFPGNPTSEFVENLFEAPSNFAESYGQRMRALISPPVTGNYVFWIATDDNGALYLSTDENPANKVLIASVNGWTSPREWTKEPNQKSAPKTLTAGKRYYIEALQKEGGGGDNLAVRWQLPGGAIEEPIPGSRMVPHGLGAPVILSQPLDAATVEGGSASFSVKLDRNLGATFLWKKSGQPIPFGTNATLLLSPVGLADNGALLQCFVTNAYGFAVSATAKLTVAADVTRPTLVSVGNLGDPNTLTLIFSERLDPASVTPPGNYAIDKSVTVKAAVPGRDGRTVILTTSTLSPGVAYTLTVNNLRDTATNPNTILANTRQTFSIDSTPLGIAFLRPNPEPIGPSSRHTPLAISEIMFRPADRADAKNLEYIEIYNSQPYPEEIGGYKLSGAFDFTIPPNTSLKGQSYLVIAPAPEDIKAVYGITNVMGGFKSDLGKTPGSIRLSNRQGAALLDVAYDNNPPWPAAADGAGHSLVLSFPSFGQLDPQAWAASDVVGGSPGKAEPTNPNLHRTILLNEFLAHSVDPDLDFVELFNYSAAAVDISGLILTDDPNTNKFVFPAGTLIAAKGFASVNQDQLGFALAAGGETVWLKSPNGTRVLDAVKFEGQAAGVSMGRFPDGAPAFAPLQSPTPGKSNAKPRAADVAINEIMYAPVSDDANDEYVELYNRSDAPVNLGKWKFTSGIGYTFPADTILPARGYIVVAKNVARLLNNYPNLNGGNTVGDFGGSLSHSGERIALSRPEPLVATNSLNQRVTNIVYVVEDEVTYGVGGRWGQWSKSGGSSLELVDSRADKNLAPNWADSDETAKSGWTTLEFTGVLDNGNDNANSLQIITLGAGEYLVDNVEVIPAGGANLIPNPDFESGLAGWVPQGNHDHSSLETAGGFNSSKSLHVRSTGHGDTGANRIRANLTSGLSAGQTATIRAKIKWLRGAPEILLRLHGSWLEATGNILAARNLGTPGAPNSVARPNAGPAITQVAHSPLLPTASQTVTVTARVYDPDGLAALVLKYRIDPSTNSVLVNMVNNGAGLYSAAIPGQLAGTLAAFQIEASDNSPTIETSVFPREAPARECLVRWGEPTPAGALGSYHLWITKATFDTWSGREKLSNEPLDGTFVYGKQRVVYNMGSQFSGSPYHSPGFNTPTGNVCDYVMVFPDDDQLLGESDISLAWPGNGGGDNTYQREQTAYWIGGELGIPVCYRRHVNLFINGTKRAEMFEDVQQPNADMVSEWFPDGKNGDLHKAAIWFEFDDAATGFSGVGANLGIYTTTGGGKKLARYRWNWPKRAIKGSANNYTNLFALADAVNTTATGDAYTRQLRSVMDVDNWLRTYLVEHIVGNNDSYAYGGGQNMYAYKPLGDTWKLMIWDIDFAFASLDPSSDLFNVGGDGVGPKLNHPPFTRAYWQAIYDAVNGPLLSTRYTPLLDGKYNAMRAAGANIESPAVIKTFLGQRRTYMLGLLGTVATTFSITSNGGLDYSTGQNLVTLTGRAPIEVRTIRVNGVDYPVVWTATTTWSLVLALKDAANTIVVTGVDKDGNAIPGASDTIKITYTGAPESPEGKVVINEIMHNPPLSEADYVELYNTSTFTTFDLSGWRLTGANYLFPGGSLIRPGGYALLLQNLNAFTTAYGTPLNYAGQFPGKLDSAGETLRLVRPDDNGGLDHVVDQVTYSPDAPWPPAANGAGASLQLIDPSKDNDRVGNWAAIPLPPAPQWQFVTANGVATSSKLLVFLASAGDVYVDDIKIQAGNNAQSGANFVQNGDFESPLTGPWTVSPNHANSAITTAVKHSGNSSLHVIATTAGSAQASSIWQTCSPALSLGQPYTLSFWYLQGTNKSQISLRFTGGGLNSSVVLPPVGAVASFTPGKANSTLLTLAEFPPLRLNEIVPSNPAGLADRLGHRHPWVELYNGGNAPVSLNGLYLSGDYAKPTQWALPANGTLAPGAFALVWLDGHPEESTDTEWHAGFSIPPQTGSVALARVANNQTNLVDYLNYNVPVAGRSYGSFPDGAVTGRRGFYFVTPAASNNSSAAPMSVFINEWMADNTVTLADPADGKFQDWFELYNGAEEPADLGGLYLSDSLANPLQFRIPIGYIVPPKGRLLVWADGEPNQNSPALQDLHVGFQLSKGGEYLGLFTELGDVVDRVTFPAQTSDVSQGRWPDGGSKFFFMTNATPRLANRLDTANTAPRLAPIPDQTVREGQILAITFQASDDDLPRQNLQFRLDTGAPEGAAVNGDTGLFTWRAAIGTANAFDVSVRVSDDGLPPLADSQTFRITVLPAPRFGSLSVGGNTLTLNWQVQAGRSYQMQSTHDLQPPVWTNVGEILPATAESLSVSDQMTSDRRFYRLVEAQ